MRKPITPEQIAHLKHLLTSVGDLPWFLSDCEGDMAIWRESALTHVIRDEDGDIEGYRTPASYKRNDLVASWDLDTWDEGEDEDDDERRRMAELIVDAVIDAADLPAYRGGRRDTIRLSVQDAAILQTFPADYPWQGTKTKAFEQIGNAVPPLLAAHVIAAATGLPLPAHIRQEAAA